MMGAIVYDLNKNSVTITKRSYHRSADLSEESGPGDIGILFSKEALAGVSIPEFLSDIELSGAAAEEAFKAFLDINSIPYLYIGQGPIGIEKSESLLGDLGSRRPDFLVNLPNLGYLFVDVKSRRKLGFPAGDESYFYLSSEELAGLVSLHRSLLIAVWVAFFDRDDADNLTFHLASVPAIDDFQRALTENLGAASPVVKHTMATVRVPAELLTTAHRQLSFRVGLQPFDADAIQGFANRYKGLHRHINRTICDLIRENPNIKKSGAVEECTMRIDFCINQEIRAHLEALIDAGEIQYEARKPLRLVGE